MNGCSLCSGKSEAEQEDLGKAEHCEENGGKVKVEARLKVGEKEGVRHCPTRKRKSERERKESLDKGPEVGWVPLYTCLDLCYGFSSSRSVAKLKHN